MRVEIKFMVLAVLGGLLAWVGNGLLEMLLLDPRLGLWGHLITALSTHELCHRVAVLFVFCAFGLVGSHVTARVRLAEEELQEAPRVLEAALDHTHMLVAYLDPRFDFVRVNRAYAEADEREPSFFPGRNHFELYPNADNEAIFRRVVDSCEAYFATAKPFEYAEHPERGMSYWDWSLVPTKDADGAVTGLVLTLLDATERKLAEHKAEETHRQLRALAKRLTDVQEKERGTLARELHDRVGPDVTSLGSILKVVRDRLAFDAREAEVRQLDDALSLVQRMAERVRDLMSELHPPELDDFGVAAALHRYGERFSLRTGVAVDVRGDAAIPRLPAEVEIALFRIAQEALTNVAKHARASRVAVTMERAGAAVRLTIVDDGVGFDATAARAPAEDRSWGMATMRERALGVGCGLHVESEPDNGTRVVVEVEGVR